MATVLRVDSFRSPISSPVNLRVIFDKVLGVLIGELGTIRRGPTHTMKAIGQRSVAVDAPEVAGVLTEVEVSWNTEDGLWKGSLETRHR